MSALVHDTIVDLLGRGIAVRFQVHGDSMYPVIHSGDYVLVEPVSFEAVAVGDVVLSLTGRGLTAHRVVTITRTTITTRGDNAPANDPPFTRDQLLGRVRAAEHLGQSREMRSLWSAATRVAAFVRRVGRRVGLRRRW